ncbi:histidine triad nucleotide-binding protein [Trujillonella endophytica]|uniref:Histidine triad (HIT) family protein n=1 Tax=Trujillonella endophytica TaxID=673521 RepID=A0A1H8QWX8_9ACTN|nr:histidine triad nucleotide-binding protein [Trujillella endophytica]SEO58511.1 histidine triad (HIT) family protein [Trujillella endophytica]
MTDCLFCRMVAGDIPADVVHETDRTLAFRDINPQAPTHVLVIPKAHHRNLGALAAADPDLLGAVVRAAADVARQEDLVTDGGIEPGYRVVTNTGPQSGQSVDHLHLHVLGGRDLRWPPG